MPPDQWFRIVKIAGKPPIADEKSVCGVRRPTIAGPGRRTLFIDLTLNPR
ncbi:MAG TPA: hypothetical protein VN639_15050 [Azonexus sp.]|nr:hypothetical protein [Azonexus sp.]